MTNKKKHECLDFNYVVVAEDLEILEAGEKLAKDNDHYVNQDESVILKSTNFTGRIIKRIQDDKRT